MKARTTGNCLTDVGLALAFLLARTVASAATTYHVAPEGDDAAAGTSWAAALATIQAGVDKTVDGDTVLVSNGTYVLSAEIAIAKGITVRGLNGSAATTVDGNSATRCFNVNHAAAMLEGFTITRGSTTDSQGGGGVLIPLGLVRNCVVSGNTCRGFGGGISGNPVNSPPGPIVRNCLVVNNTAGRPWHNGGGGYGGGIWLRSYGTVDSCTVAGNTATYSCGGLQGYGGGRATNTIAFGNSSPGSAQNISIYARNCCAPELGASAGNVNQDPRFVDPDAGDYRLQPGSPCIDAGASNGWMAGAADLDGAARISGTANDMGVYESVVGALNCGFVADDTQVFLGQAVVFSASVTGNNTNFLYYDWAFPGNGTATSIRGEGRAVVTNSFAAPGAYTVALTVTNGAGESVTHTGTDFIAAGPSNVFVSPSGLNVSPYTNWTSAANAIETALSVAVDDSVIRVTNGAYVLSDTIGIDKAVTIRGENGPGATSISGGGAVRCFYITNVNAVLYGLTIKEGTSELPGRDGGGVHLQWRGMVQNCVVVSNYGVYGGGVYCNNGGTVRNCLLARNSGGYGAGIFADYSCLVQSCTLSDNEASSYGGGFYGAGTFRNSIIYYNTAPNSPEYHNGGYAYCCSPSLVSGTGNLSDAPGFADRSAANYRLAAGSPCIDAGLSNAWMAGAVDLDENPRIVAGTNDMGAYEFKAAGLTCSFSGNPTKGAAPLNVVFSGFAAGEDLSGLVYKWDFDNDSVVDLEGPDKQTVTNTYEVGTYSVTLKVVNDAMDEAAKTELDYITASHACVYVSKTGSHTSPYTNWATAATDIQSAVNVGGPGTTVLIEPGTYAVASEVSVTNGIVVRGGGRPEDTIVDGGGATRCFALAHADAALENLTLQNGRGSGGGGATVYGGAVIRNCIIRNCFSSGSMGAVKLDGGHLRNCLLFGNSANSWGGAVGNYNSGTIDSCTIVSNKSLGGVEGGGGVYQNGAAGWVDNSIVYFNEALGASANVQNVNPAARGCRYTCTYPTYAYGGGTGSFTNAPRFLGGTLRPWRLAPSSPCRDAGLFSDWMTDAEDLTGAGRIFNGTVDMGAYEWRPPLGTLIMAN